MGQERTQQMMLGGAGLMVAAVCDRRPSLHHRYGRGDPYPPVRTGTLSNLQPPFLLFALMLDIY